MDNALGTLTHDRHRVIAPSLLQLRFASVATSIVHKRTTSGSANNRIASDRIVNGSIRVNEYIDRIRLNIYFTRPCKAGPRRRR